MVPTTHNPFDFSPHSRQWREPWSGLRDAAACVVAVRKDRIEFRNLEMAKPATVKIRLVSSADTGFFYVTKKNPRNTTEKMSFNKYDPVVRKHVAFKEAKIK